MGTINADNDAEPLDDWEEFDSEVAQTLADYLGIRVAGFDPLLNADIDRETEQNLVLPDIDAPWARHPGIAQITILSGLIHGTATERDLILASVDHRRFWDRSLDKYLFELIRDQIRSTGKLSVQDILKRIPDFTRLVYGYEQTRRDALGHYYLWVQILRLRPTSEQILRAIEILNQNNTLGPE